MAGHFGPDHATHRLPVPPILRQPSPEPRPVALAQRGPAINAVLAQRRLAAALDQRFEVRIERIAGGELLAQRGHLLGDVEIVHRRDAAGRIAAADRPDPGREQVMRLIGQPETDALSGQRDIKCAIFAVANTFGVLPQPHLRPDGAGKSA